MTDNKMIVALDLPQKSDILSLAQKLVGEVEMVKVGLEAFVAHGPTLVQELKAQGHHIFLDLKLHDIPRTAAAAAAQASKLGVRLLTIHACGGAEMIHAVCEAAVETKIIAVTMLTSFDDNTAQAAGFSQGVSKTALQLGELALAQGAAGLVCSAHELQALAKLGGVRVVPGIRSVQTADDQKRTATARQAVDQGATWIVVGRPILQAADPVQAVRAMAKEL